MELQLQTINSDASAGQLVLADEVFARDYNEPLIHQVVTAYLAGARSGTKAQKTRAQVRGGGAKPWRQKGTGRARAGTSRSPLWRGGGRTFAAQPRSYEQKVNRKMYRAALRSILSELVRQERLIAVDDLAFNEPKTKLVISALEKLGVSNVLLVCNELGETLFRAARNIPGVGMVEVGAIDPVMLVSYDHVVITQQALADLEAALK